MSPHFVEFIELLLVEVDVSVFVIFGHNAHHLPLLETDLAAIEFVVDGVHHVLDLFHIEHPILVKIILIEQFIKHLAHFLLATGYMFHLFPLFEDDVSMFVDALLRLVCGREFDVEGSGLFRVMFFLYAASHFYL